MIYHASVRDDCMQPFRFYPVLTGEAYQELVVPDWIWSALLTLEAIYYDILPVLRIDRETGNVTEWGLRKRHIRKWMKRITRYAIWAGLWQETGI